MWERGRWAMKKSPCLAAGEARGRVEGYLHMKMIVEKLIHDENAQGLPEYAIIVFDNGTQKSNLTLFFLR